MGTRAPVAKVSSIRRDQTNATVKVTPAVLGAEVGRFVDEAFVLISQAADSFALQVGTAEARALALSWKTGAANNSMIIASGPNPIANLLDMVVLVTLSRITMEDHWVPRFGKPAEPMLEACRKLDQEIWQMASRVLSQPQQEELRELIRGWKTEHPDQLYIGVRLRDFAEMAAVAGSRSSWRTGSVFGLLRLDPFAGLDPATREMEQTRYFAERALFVLERIPGLLRLQSELFMQQSLATPDVQQVLSNSARFVQSAEQLAQSVQKFPEQVAAEREKLMNAATAQMPQWQALLEQFEQSFEAGQGMAASVESATRSLDSFVARFHVEPAAGFSAAPQTTNGAGAREPFDVTEYGVAAAQIGQAAEELDALLSSLETATPKLKIVAEQTRIEGMELVDYTFRKAVWFLVLGLAGLLLVLIVYRWIAFRLTVRQPTEKS